jgi:hypothetical protein
VAEVVEGEVEASVGKMVMMREVVVALAAVAVKEYVLREPLN